MPHLSFQATVSAIVAGVLVLALIFRLRRMMRIVDTRSALLSAIMTLAMTGKYLATEPPEELVGLARSNVEIDRTARMGAAKDRIGKMFDEVGEYASAYRQPVMGIVVTYITTLHGVMLSARAPERKGAIVADLSESLALLIGVPLWQLWHLPKRIAALGRFKQALMEIDADADAVVASQPARHAKEHEPVS